MQLKSSDLEMVMQSQYSCSEVWMLDTASHSHPLFTVNYITLYFTHWCFGGTISILSLEQMSTAIPLIDLIIWQTIHLKFKFIFLCSDHSGKRDTDADSSKSRSRRSWAKTRGRAICSSLYSTSFFCSWARTGGKCFTLTISSAVICSHTKPLRLSLCT